jgi:hypothetical protein
MPDAGDRGNLLVTYFNSSRSIRATIQIIKLTKHYGILTPNINAIAPIVVNTNQKMNIVQLIILAALSDFV